MSYFNRFVFVCSVLLSACGGGSSGGVGVAPYTVVLVVEVSGGCMMAGPNCPRFVLRADGGFDVYRVGEEGVVLRGSVEKWLVSELIAEVENVDFDVLRNDLTEGVCRACFDGVDFEYTLLPDSRNETISSRDYKISKEVSLFEMYLDITSQMNSSAQLPFIPR